MTTLPVFERLSTHYNRQAFDCGKPSLNEFLQRQARQSASRNIGVTHVAVRVAGDSKILAYYTLLVRDVDAAIIPTKKLPKGPTGVVLLGRLAVDQTAQGKGLANSACCARCDKWKLPRRRWAFSPWYWMPWMSKRATGT